jgi:hypothetical protein
MGWSSPTVSQPQGRQNSLEGKGRDKKRTPSCNGSDRGSKFAPDRKESRLTLGLMRKRPIKETEFEDKLDVEVKLNKRTEETAERLEPD